MTRPDSDPCPHFPRCSGSGKISDFCFDKNDPPDKVIERIRDCRRAEAAGQSEPPIGDLEARITIIEHSLKRLDACIDSVLSIVSKHLPQT